MTALDMARAPASAQPLRYLYSAACWGVAAGAWLLWHGSDALLSRWALPTLVLVHLFTLGVMANAMLGSLLQFLPVAAGSPLRRGGWAYGVHAALNLGLLLFVPGMLLAHAGLLYAAACLLAGSLSTFAALALIALLRGAGLRLLRIGIGLALAALVATVALGAALAALLLGHAALPVSLVDLHAASGTLGWMLMLVVSVGSITLPMFQGTRPVPPAWLRGWMALALLGLCGGAIGLRHGAGLPLAAGVAAPGLAFMLASLWLQARARHRRNPSLMAFWALGTLLLGAACVLLLAPMRADAAVLIGALAIGGGFPLLMTGMQLEITGFITWLDLRMRCPRGIRIPGVDRLLPERDKRLSLYLHAAAALALTAAALFPVLATLAALALIAAYLSTLRALLRCRRRAIGFLAATH